MRLADLAVAVEMTVKKRKASFIGTFMVVVFTWMEKKKRIRRKKRAYI